jgi:hypothetical protein
MRTQEMDVLFPELIKRISFLQKQVTSKGKRRPKYEKIFAGFPVFDVPVPAPCERISSDKAYFRSG